MTDALWRIVSEAVLFGLLVIFEIVIRYIRRRRKNEFNEAKLHARDPKELEAITLAYNKRQQYLEIVHFGVIAIAVLLALLAYDIQAFSFLLLGIGALFVILRETVGSFVAYFYILVAYDVGDDIRIGDSLGEINKIGPLYISIIGKEESGEYNGKLINIPNYLFFQQKAERQELKTTNYRRTSILYVHNREHMKRPFPEVVKKFRAFVDEILPLRQVVEIGSFRNYAGRRYRLALDYNDAGHPTMRVTFVASPDEIGGLRERIITFLEETGKAHA